MRTQHENEAGAAVAAVVDAGAVLEMLLRDHPDALVAAMSADGVLVPMPESVPLRGQRVFGGRSGLDLLVASDHLLVADAWRRAQEEPVVHLDVHLLASPDELSTVHIVDVRSEHGVHLLVLEQPAPEIADRPARPLAPPRHGVARTKKDGVSVFLEVDAATTAMLGWSADELIGHSTIEFIHPDDVQGAMDSWMAMRAGTGAARARVRFRHADGHYVWLEVTNDNRLDDPTLRCVVSEMVDISAEMAQLEILRERERLFARLAEALPIGICHLRPDRAVVYTNEPLVELLGPIEDVDGLICSVAGPDREIVAIALDHALGGRAGVIEVGVLHGYEERRCELTFRAMAGDCGGVDGVIICAADVTDRSRLRSELEHRASHDALTGCLNRAATVAALERALRENRHVAVAYLDLDRFKSINDELGHAAGDELLRVAAARLRQATRVDDRLGRIGGDEFVVITPRGEGPFEAAALGDRLRAAVNGDVVFANQRIPLRAAIGVAMSLDGEADAEALLHRADTAMYAAKRQTRRGRRLNAL